MSPERTRDFYQRLNPKASKLEFPHGNGSLDRVSVPDGILIKEDGANRSRVLFICEYSVSEDTNTSKKRKGFDQTKALYPSIVNQASILFFAPKDSKLNDVKTFPFTAPEFGYFMKNIFRIYRTTEDDATLVEVQQRARTQYAKALEYSKKGVLTREQKAYLDKVVTSPSLI